MRVIHLSYAVPKPRFTDPEAWLRRINFSIGVLESMTSHAEILGIYHIHYKGVLKRNGVTYYFPGYNRWQLLLPFGFNRFVKSLAPDVIIVHGIIFPWQILMLRYTLGNKIKIIAQHHAERPLRDIRQYLQRWADRYIGAYLFCSFDLAKPWVDRHQVRDLKKVKEIMGTSSSFYPMDENAAQLATGVSGDPVFLWVGGLDANKDPLTVARAFVKFSKTHPAARLFMIYQMNQLFDELKILISDGQAENHILLIGKIDNPDLIHWYNSADFIISSSHYEGSGIAVCEGLSCGCIPILTNIPSFRMMTDNGRIGLLYKAGNEQELLAALQKSLTINLPEEKGKVLEQFNNELSFEANARKIMNVINELQQ
ncbi:MAG TPA: glycosyltransferase family 4 protein [Cyclobacteriaceae bacterium]|nr:glycosyltransferase family 4 protein [Cyclobacteriaceae bacterium]